MLFISNGVILVTCLFPGNYSIYIFRLIGVEICEVFSWIFVIVIFPLQCRGLYLDFSHCLLERSTGLQGRYLMRSPGKSRAWERQGFPGWKREGRLGVGRGLESETHLSSCRGARLCSRVCRRRGWDWTLQAAVPSGSLCRPSPVPRLLSYDPRAYSGSYGRAIAQSAVMQTTHINRADAGDHWLWAPMEMLFPPPENPFFSLEPDYERRWLLLYCEFHRDKLCGTFCLPLPKDLHRNLDLGLLARGMCHLQ